MDPTIISAIIAGVFLLLSILLSKVSLNRNKNSRRIGINGTWKGQVYQYVSPYGEPIEYPITMNFQVNNSNITGSISYEFENDPMTILIEGHFRDDSMAFFTYEDRDMLVIRWGAIGCEFTADAKVLRGAFMGYAAEISGFTTGTFEAKKH